MADIRIRVGASVDSSVETVFPRVAAAARKARVQVEEEFSRAMPRAMKKGADKSEEEFRKLVAEVSGKGRHMMDPGTRSITEFAAHSRSNFAAIQKEFRNLSRVADAELNKVSRSAINGRDALGRFTGGAKDRGWAGVLNPRIRTSIPNPWTPVLGMARRMTMDVIRGAGVNLDPASMVQSFVSRQALAQDIANSGFQPGAKGAAGKLQNADTISAEAMKVAQATATDPTKALEGLQKFVATTGDLETGRAILGDMAKLSNATGSNLEDVVTAAGDVSAKLGDVPHKAESINAIMRQIAGQGKLGAVEMRDFAKQLASVAAIAPQFSGSVEKNIGEMAILLQEGRQMGGAKNAAQAATGVRAFASTFTKGARVKEFAALGISLRNKDGGLRSAEEIILESLSKTKGNANTLYGKLFSSEQSKVAVRGFETIYNHTQGTDAQKLQAVADEFDRLRKATMSQADVEEANARKMNTAQAQAQAFNNQLQQIADETSAHLLPAMREFAPSIVAATKGIGEALVQLAPAIQKAAQALAQMLGLQIGQTSNGADISNSIGDTLEARNLGEHGGTVKQAEFKRLLAVRDELANKTDSDQAALDKFKEEHAGIEDADPDKLAASAAKGDATAKEYLAKTATLAQDKESADAMEAAMSRVMKSVFAGTLKVEVVGNKGLAPADQTGRQPVAGK